MWIARDKSGDLWLYTKEKPKRNEEYGIWEAYENIIDTTARLNKNDFEYLTWEDEPEGVCLCLSNGKYHTVQVEELDRVYEVYNKARNADEIITNHPIKAKIVKAIIRLLRFF